MGIVLVFVIVCTFMSARANSIRLHQVLDSAYGNAQTSDDKVSSPPKFKEEPTWPQSPYYDEFGPPISLSCDLVPDNDVTLLWYQNGDLLRPHKTLAITNANQTLTLINPEQNQTGSYKCFAYNLQGNISHTGYIYISARKQETRPRVVLTNPDNLVKHAKIGDNVTIGCTFDIGGSTTGLLDFGMNWHKENQSVDDTNHTTWGINRTQTLDQILSLTIYSFNVSDYGAYKCIGVNHLGNDSRVVFVVPPDLSKGKLPLPVIIAASVSSVFIVLSLMTTAKWYRVRRNRKYEHLEWDETDVGKYDVPKYTLKFDVFISYSHEDLLWVKDILFQTLAGRSYEVCLDFKDFVPGMATSENIMDAIYSSRKTIVLMSKHFLKSTWGQFELQQAHFRAISQRKDVLILVKVDDCKVPAKLMGKTFLDWTDDKVRPHFWDRLLEALGEPGHYSADDQLLTDIGREPVNQDDNKTEGDIEQEITKIGEETGDKCDVPLLDVNIENEDKHIDDINKQ